MNPTENGIEGVLNRRKYTKRIFTNKRKYVKMWETENTGHNPQTLRPL